MFKRIPFDRVDWITSAFLIITFFVALIGAPWYLYNYGIDWFQAVMFFFYAGITTMSITLGYHRLFSHIAFKAKWPVRFVTLVFGACTFENSCLDWSSDHRRHHKHVDHEGDPYDISKGFMWAHIGWLMFKLGPEPPMDNVGDLRKDPLVMWQHKWVHLIGVIVGFVFPSLLGYWHSGATGALGGFLLAGVTRVVLVQHCTFFINSLCHTIGKQPYNSGNSARDSWIMAIFTCGEGYHNYHHCFQHDYRNGVKPWQFDPTKWMIWLLSKVGLASNLRRVAPDKILKAEIREARRLIENQRGGLEGRDESCPLSERAEEALEQLASRLTQCYNEIEEAMAEKIEVSRGRLEEWHAEIRQVVRHIGKVRVPAS